MISIIYGGNTSGPCYELYQHILHQIPKQQRYDIFLQQSNIDFLLTTGYHAPLSSQQQIWINQLEASSTLIFIYPLYWFNVTPILKSFIDQTFWPEHAFSFKNKQYFRNGLWKGKKAIIIYTQGGPEILHRFKGRLGYKVMKYPLNLSGIYDISVLHLDNLNRSATDNKKVVASMANIAQKVKQLIRNK